MKGGRALLRLRCAGGGRCAGVAKLSARVRARRVVKRRDRGRVAKRARRVLIGKARFAIPAGASKVIRVKLNRKGKALLRGARRHRLEAKLGGRGVKPRTVVLREAQSKRRRSRGAARQGGGQVSLGRATERR